MVLSGLRHKAVHESLYLCLGAPPLTPLFCYTSASDITAFVQSSEADTTTQPWLHSTQTFHLCLQLKHLKHNVVKWTDGSTELPKNSVIIKVCAKACSPFIRSRIADWKNMLQLSSLCRIAKKRQLQERRGEKKKRKEVILV